MTRGAVDIILHLFLKKKKQVIKLQSNHFYRWIKAELTLFFNMSQGDIDETSLEMDVKKNAELKLTVRTSSSSSLKP